MPVLTIQNLTTLGASAYIFGPDDKFRLTLINAKPNSTVYFKWEKDGLPWYYPGKTPDVNGWTAFAATDGSGGWINEAQFSADQTGIWYESAMVDGKVSKTIAFQINSPDTSVAANSTAVSSTSPVSLPPAGGRYAFNVQATDADGNACVKSYNINVAANADPAIASSSLPLLLRTNRVRRTAGNRGSLAASLAEILKANNINDAIAIADQAGLLVTENAQDPTQISLEIKDPATGKIVAALRDDGVLGIDTSGNSTGETAVCKAGTDDSSARVYVSSTQKIYAVTGNYNINLNCMDGNPQKSCDMMNSALNTNVGYYNAVSEGPQGTIGGMLGSQNINVVLYPKAADIDSSAAQNGFDGEAFIKAVDGTDSFVTQSGATCNINIFGDTLSRDVSTIILETNSSILDKGTDTQVLFQTLQNAFGYVLEHEMGHCFGIAHTPGSYLMTIRDEISLADSLNIIQKGPIPLAEDTTELVQALQQINNGKLEINDCKAMSAGYCAPGKIWDFFNNKCVVPTSPSVPPPTVERISCDCVSDVPICIDETTGQNIIPPNNTGIDICQPPTAPPLSEPKGIVCVCDSASGTASCADDNGNEVSVPASFVCNSGVETGGTSGPEGGLQACLDPEFPGIPAYLFGGECILEWEN
jgi:hypothetical protein